MFGYAVCTGASRMTKPTSKVLGNPAKLAKP